MNQSEKAKCFSDLHVKGRPCVLYNVWDAGTAQAVEQAGAAAIATGSWSVAAAQGFKDGEHIPLDLVESIVRRICTHVSLPVSVDFEGGYAAGATELAVHVERIIKAGAIGINFEDRVVQGEGLYDIDLQCERIAAIRATAIKCDVPLFINARTDVFFQPDSEQTAELLQRAKERAEAYREAGASGLFVPGLRDEGLIAQLCQEVRLPVNIMMSEGVASKVRLAELGVARVSYGPRPYLGSISALTERAAAIYSG